MGWMLICYAITMYRLIKSHLHKHHDKQIHGSMKKQSFFFEVWDWTTTTPTSTLSMKFHCVSESSRIDLSWYVSNTHDHLLIVSTWYVYRLLDLLSSPYSIALNHTNSSISIQLMQNYNDSDAFQTHKKLKRVQIYVKMDITMHSMLALH